MKAGNIIEKIDGQEITPESDYSVLLNGKARKKTLVTLYNPQTKERWEEVVVPVSNGVMSDLLYARWVKQRAADVDKWSNGRLGYVHIESMGDDSFRSVYSDILGKYNNREGIVIDTRFNGGGRLHEDIEILFSGKKYFTQVVRGREACDMPSRRWNKPSIMVQCEANYSNAHDSVGIQPSKNRQAGRYACTGNHDQRILGNIAGSDTGIRHSCYRLSLAGWKLSGKFTIRAGYQSGQFTGNSSER